MGVDTHAVQKVRESEQEKLGKPEPRIMRTQLQHDHAGRVFGFSNVSSVTNARSQTTPLISVVDEAAGVLGTSGVRVFCVTLWFQRIPFSAMEPVFLQFLTQLFVCGALGSMTMAFVDDDIFGLRLKSFFVAFDIMADGPMWIRVLMTICLLLYTRILSAFGSSFNVCIQALVFPQVKCSNDPLFLLRRMYVLHVAVRMERHSKVSLCRYVRAARVFLEPIARRGAFVAQVLGSPCL